MCTQWNRIFVVGVKKIPEWAQGSESSSGPAGTGEQAAKGREPGVSLMRVLLQLTSLPASVVLVPVLPLFLRVCCDASG